jgi:hypothetical protein
MIENQDKKYIRYIVGVKDFHMYINAYDVVYKTSRFRSTQIYVESYDRDFYVKFCLNYNPHTVSIDCIQYAPKCTLTTYFVTQKDALFYKYLAAALQLIHAEFPDFHTVEVQDQLALNISTQSMHHAYQYLSFYTAVQHGGKSWFEHYFNATPMHLQDTLKSREALFTQKPELNDLVYHGLHIEYEWMAFMEKYYHQCASQPTLRAFIKTFMDSHDYNTLSYWYPPYARSNYHIPYKLTFAIPSGEPYYIVVEQSVHPLIEPLSDDTAYYAMNTLIGTDEQLVVKNEGLSTMWFSMGDIEDD